MNIINLNIYLIVFFIIYIFIISLYSLLKNLLFQFSFIDFKFSNKFSFRIFSAGKTVSIKNLKGWTLW